MDRNTLLALAIVTASTWSFAGEIVEDLPAGGKYVFATKWDKYTINCTADPVAPTVLSTVCACDNYYLSGKGYLFRLTAKAFLSNGKTMEMSVSEALPTLDACKTEKKDLPELCK